MLAARAAEADGQPAPALIAETRNDELEEIGDAADELLSDRLGQDERANFLVQPVERPEPVDVERVLHEADVEDHVGLERDAVLVPEADELDGQLLALVGQIERAVETLAQLSSGQLGRVD